MNPQDPQNQASDQNSVPLQPSTNSSGNFAVANAQEVTPQSVQNNVPDAQVPAEPIQNIEPITPENQNAAQPEASPTVAENQAQNIANLDNTATQTSASNNPQQSNLDPNAPLNPFDNGKAQKPTSIFRKLLIPIIIVIVLIILVVGGFYFFKNNNKGETGDITMWGFEDPIIWQPTFEKYKQANGVNINYKRISPNNYELVLLEAFATRSTPDIFPIRSDWFEKHSNKIVPTETKADIPEYYPYAKSLLTKDDKRYGITVSQDSLALFYNKDLVGTLNPADFQYWDQIKQWASTATVKSGADITTSAIPLGIGSNNNYAADILAAILMQNSATMTSQDNTTVEYDKVIQRTGVGDYYPGIEGLDFFTSFARIDSANYSWNSSLPTSYEAFGSAKSKTYIGYSRDIQVFKDKYPLLNYSVLPLPQIRNSDKNFSISQFWSYSVSKDSPRPLKSWNLLNTLAKPENLKTVNTALRIPSPYPSVTSTDEIIQVFDTQNKTATNWKKFDQFMLDNDLMVASNDVVTAGQTPKIAITNAANKSNEYIQKKINERKGNMSNEGKTIFRVWSLDTEDESIKKVIADLDKKTNKFSVISVTVPSDELERRFLEESANNTGPDLLAIPQNKVPRWKNRLLSFFNSDNRLDFVKKNLIKSSYDNNIIDNKLYGLSLYKNIFALAYNTEITKNHRIYSNPQTWTDLMGNIEKINEESPDLYGVSISKTNTTNAADILSLMMLQSGIDLHSEDKSSATFYLPQSGSTEPKGQKALTLYNTFAQVNNLPTRDIDLFKQGKLGYIFTYWNGTYDLESNNISIRYAPVPQISTDVETPIDLSQNISLVIPKRSSNAVFASNIIWQKVNSGSIDINRPSTKIIKNEISRKSLNNPFTRLGNNAIDIYKGGNPEIYNFALENIINGKLTFEQAGDLINKSWH